jgi:hypothetical protein
VAENDSTTARAELRGLLGDAEHKYQLRAEIEPLFERADRGEYPLSPESEELKGEALTALRSVFGEEVQRVFLVSLEHPFPRPVWMTEEACKFGFWKSLQGYFVHRFSDRLDGKRFWTIIQEKLEVKNEDNLAGKLGDIIRISILNSIGDNLGDSLRDSLMYHSGNTLWNVLCYFLGYAICDDEEKVEKLRPLIRLLPKANPLGEKKDEPGTWIVLVA